MKNRKMILAMAAVTLLVAGCQKEKNFDGMLILAEGFNSQNTKVAVNNEVSTWANGDMVRINNQTATVSKSDNQARVTLSEETSSPFYGVYPADLCSNISGATNTLTLPASYAYATDGTYQLLATPMVGYTNDASVMVFKHVTAAITVEIKNDFGIDVKVTNITVSSNKYKLCGPTEVTISSSITVNPVVENEDAALRQVQMTFGSTALNIASGSTASVQVPVLPVGGDNRFTISVTVQNKDDEEMVYTFTKTQGNSLGENAYALGRRELGYAPAKFGGVFSVAANKQVRFAPGNLQYQASTGTWRFAQHQYEYVGNAAGNTTSVSDRAEQSAWIDLFGWGTSGWDNGNAKYQPWCADLTNFTSCEYGPKSGETFYDLSGDYANSDWGVYNSISNGGAVAGRWYTLTNTEWNYLTNYSRAASNVVNSTSRAKFTYATVGTTHGIIFFPDEFDVPTFIGNSSWGTINSSSDWTTTIELVDWNLLETAGCIFLPATGSRSATTSQNPLYSNENSYGNYWSSVQATNANAYYMRFYSANGFTAKDASKYQGFSVRLVRDVE